MALIDDMNAIAIASNRAMGFLRLAALNEGHMQGDHILDDDSKITLTAGQKAALAAKVGPLITIIKNRAALLP